MNKWIVFVVLLGAGYFAYQEGYTPWSKTGAFDAEGKPVTRLFISPNCPPCDDVQGLLRSRGVDYELVDISDPKADSNGIRQVPVTLVGSTNVVGSDSPRIVSALAENYGPEMLTANEQIAMRNHFDEQGKPMVVMYGTQWCPYCKRQRDFFADKQIDYYEIDVEASSAGKLAYEMLQGTGYPLTYVGYRRFNGYQEEGIEEALRELR